MRAVAVRAIVALLVVVSAVPPSLRAQLAPPPPRDTRGEYLSIVSGRVGETLRHVAAAFNTGDLARAASFYQPEVFVQLHTGGTFRGRDALHALFTKVQPRVRNLRFEKLDVVNSGEMAFMSGVMTYEVLPASGGDYERSVPVGMAFRETREGWRISSQIGGDFAASFAKVGDLAPSMPAGAGDTLRMRLTDATGHPIGNVSVFVEVLAGGGSVDGTALFTDTEGVARTWFRTGAEAGRNVVRVVAASLDREPLLFDTRTAVGTAATPDRGPPTTTN